ncbi:MULTISPECIES: ketopantoate reductase C-terminal domain-containing protein [unclassified Streptomyces]|uniref:ketopantoate reductase C-terminal domain-containing protein n=1 Tax=unclassified Streptomyces TaxID=2593676 RepID=UPI001BEA2D3C|nr:MULTISPECIES: ketopantoate reductase C-terminal domain-containing protein [unclassified Streptomyces]MBT2403095.1 hypothetical protein [Streptomyces sp. ISL-21]MBT2610228.1 hypothetical protein [Streptomyces sp. ISL-87]
MTELLLYARACHRALGTEDLYRNAAAGRPTEVEHPFGDLVARARELSVATPLLDLATLRLRIHQRSVVGG